MAIKIKIVGDSGVSEDSNASGEIKIKIVKEGPEPVQVELNARRALNGDIMIFDHDLIDIVISPEKNKIVTFPKDLSEREVYPTQDRFMTFLRKKGIIKPESVQGGNIFSSIEAEINKSIIEGVNALESSLFVTSLFLEDEKVDIQTRDRLKKDIANYMLDPDVENSTDLGEIPQSDRKGTMDNRVRPYGYQYMYSILRESEEE
jgi:hypothetical protein